MFRKVFAAFLLILGGVAVAGAASLCDFTGWQIVPNEPVPTVYQRDIVIGDSSYIIPADYNPMENKYELDGNTFTIMQIADAPKLKFIPICESLPPGSGTIECIPERQISAQATLTAWRAASLKIINVCEKVIIDKTKPMNDSTNIGFRCNGILTGSGLIPDTE